jgi:2-succinyl-6-hydroxy-2,4-cyclohexadiene-1-carboxylate synthase
MTVVALHGFAGSGADWAPFERELGWAVVAPDLLGHGAAAAPDNSEAYRVGPMVKSAAVGMPSDGPVVLMGYSMGGRVALRLAPQLGPRLCGLVLMGAHPGLEDSVERSERIAADQSVAGMIEERGIEWFCDFWADQPLIRSQRRIRADIRDEMSVRRAANRTVGLAGSLRGFGQGAIEPVWFALPSLCVPTLLVTGADDTKYTGVAERMVKLLPDAQHTIIPGAGHCVHLEAIGPTAEAVGSFLNRVSG